MKTMRASQVLFLSLLLLSCVELPLKCVEAQDSNSPVNIAPETTVPAAGERIFVATLSKALDAKKTKAGSVVIALEADSIDPASSGFITFLGRVVEVHARGKANTDSVLLIRFDKIKLGNNQEVSAHLNLQAVAAPLAARLMFSPIRVDTFPCDDETHPKECGEAKKQNQIAELGLGPMKMNVCGKNPAKGKGQPRDICVLASKANGVYGLPDLSLSPHPPNSEQDFAITSKKKNVRLEENTVFIFSSSDVHLMQPPQP